MLSSPTISIHLVPRAMLSLSPEDAARMPLRNQTRRSRDSAHTAFSPTLTCDRGDFPSAGASTSPQPVPVGSSRLTPRRTRALPFHVTAHTRPEGDVDTWLISQPSGVLMWSQPVPSGHEAVTPCRTITLPITVTVHTIVSSGSPLGMSLPPTAMSMKGSSAWSLCTPGTADHESVAAYRLYRIHFLRLTHDVRPLLAEYWAGKSTAYVQPCLSSVFPLKLESTYHSDSHCHASDGSLTPFFGLAIVPSIELKLGRSVGRRLGPKPSMGFHRWFS